VRGHALLLAALLAVQSLADVARREAERRREIDRQGIAAKVIEGDPSQLARSGNVSTSAQSPRIAIEEAGTRGSRTGSSRSYRTAIQKLDREIGSAQDRLVTLRERIQAERWAPPKAGKAGRSSAGTASQENLQWQVRDLELKIKRMRRERSAIYDEGRRAGYQPGELDGRGQLP